MPRSLRSYLGRIKGFVLSYSKHALRFAAYKGLIPSRWSDRIIKGLWMEYALDIHQQFGMETNDYGTLVAVIRRYQPRTVLDAGCGSGRLFKLYEQCGVRDFTGTDISATALEIARSAFPNAKLRQLRLEDLDYPPKTFDLCICNRTLQHIPERSLQTVIQKLTEACRLVYVNELSRSDGQHDTFWMLRHDYPRRFEEAGFECLETGTIGQQTYFVFGRAGDVESRPRVS